ncbi:MAG: hypothetical protein O2884_10400, partial [Chloroflexi bacterium]|nr:hypothetical protein [Chloroflexota bacterium]
MRISSPFRILPLVVLATIAALVAACGGDSTPTPTQSPQATSTPTATAAPAATATPTRAPDPVATATPTVAPIVDPTVEPTTGSLVTLVAHQTLGNVLADGAGNVLYLYTRDERETSNCSGGCLTAWPPLMTDGTPQAGDGVNADRLGVIQAPDGKSQVTYNGWPLYYFANDAAPGEARGQDRGDVWYVVSAFGGPIFTAALVNLSTEGLLGAHLVDNSGRVQYLYTRDEKSVSNCSGNCALSWPPLLSVDAPTAGDGVTADRLSTTVRADGSKQVTYNGWPLYYYAKDVKPGGTVGQDRGDVWYLLGPDGGPIQTSAAVTLSASAMYGDILTTVGGRSIYLYTRDEPLVTNCSGGCARSWPPILTVDAPTAGEGVDGTLLGVISRGDGSKQVTYNGWPLYLYANDEKPGDVVGQARGEVWYVLNAAGEMVVEAVPQPVTSSISNFSLQDLTIAVGETVRWTNSDSAPHTATSGAAGALSGVWDSDDLTQGQSYDFAFTEAGVFPYFCTIHP